MNVERHARVFRNGSNQAIRIPREFEFSEEEVVIRKEGNTLIIQPVVKQSLLSLLASLSPLDGDWPDIDEKILPLDDVDLTE